MIALVQHPDDESRLGDLLRKNLCDEKWHVFRAAVAFAKISGTKHFCPHLRQFSRRGEVNLSVGIDHRGTSFEALNELLASLGDNGEAYVFHNEALSTFHPKVYLFANDEAAECFLGSGNLTEGGLFTNCEVFVHLQLHRKKRPDSELLAAIEAILDGWSNPALDTVRRLTPELLKQLQDSDLLPTEAQIREIRTQARATPAASAAVATPTIFGTIKFKPAPKIATAPRGKRTTAVISGPATAGGKLQGFLITLQNTDVGFGQKTPGAQRRAAELFIPKICVRRNPGFWGWPKLFKPDRKWNGPRDGEGFTKMDRTGVRMRLGIQNLLVNWWYNPKKRDYRMRNETLRGAGNVGDILRIELARRKADFDYYVEVIPQGTSLFSHYLALCTESVRNSPKKFGYY